MMAPCWQSAGLQQPRPVCPPAAVTCGRALASLAQLRGHKPFREGLTVRASAPGLAAAQQTASRQTDDRASAECVDEYRRSAAVVLVNAEGLVFAARCGLKAPPGPAPEHGEAGAKFELRVIRLRPCVWGSQVSCDAC